MYYFSVFTRGGVKTLSEQEILCKAQLLIVHGAQLHEMWNVVVHVYSKVNKMSKFN